MAGFWDILNAGLSTARNAVQQAIQQAQTQQPAQKSAASPSAPSQAQAPQAGGVWKSLTQPSYGEQPVGFAPAESVPQTVAPGEPQQGVEEPKEEKKSEETETEESSKKKQNPSMFQQVLDSVAQNPDTQAILQNPLNAFIPQTAEADTGTGAQAENMPDYMADANNMAMPAAEQLAPESQEKEPAQGYSHDYDALRDWGGVVPIVGPLFSMAGGLGNVLSSNFNYDMPNATSQARDVVESGEYVADPNVLAMPTAQDVRSSMNDEDFKAWIENTATPLDSFISESFMPGIGGAISSAASKTAKLAAKEGRDLAVSAIEDAVKKGDEAAEKIANKAGRAKPDKAANAASKEFVDSYVSALPKDIQDYVINSMPYATRLGKMAGAKEAEQVLPVANALQDAATNKQLVGEFAGNTVPRFLRPLAMETGGFEGAGASLRTEEAAEKKEESKPKDKSEETIMGMTPEAWAGLSQREQYNKALEDQALRDYYQRTYGDNIVGDLGYEYFRDLGEASSYQDKHDLVRDLFGYNRDAEGNSQYGINGWQDLAADSINGIGNMEDEEAIQAIMEYMWGAGNIIDPYQYIQDSNYQKLHSLGSDDAANFMGQYFGQNYFNGPGVENFLGTIKTQNGEQMYPMLDNADLGEWIMAGNLLANPNVANYTEDDMTRLSNLLGLGGENQLFGFVNDDDNMNWNKTDWNSSGRDYSAQSLMDTLVANSSGQGVPLNIYNGPGNENNALISEDLADDLMAYISQQTHKTVGRRTKD